MEKQEINIEPSERVIGYPYSSIYDKLLKLIPNLLNYLEQDKGFDLYVKTESSGFMPLVFENKPADRNGDYRIYLYHYYKQSGDDMLDPLMGIRIIPVMQMAESLFYESSNPPIYKEVYPFLDEKEMVNLQEKKSQNIFLNQWLKNLLDQGFKVDLSKFKRKEKLNEDVLLTEIEPIHTQDQIEVPQNIPVEIAKESYEANNAIGNQIEHILNTHYKNPYELNKAIESLIDIKESYNGESYQAFKDYTFSEKEFIKKYSGYGGLEKFGAEGKGILYEYYTPDKIIRKMWQLAYTYGYSGGSVLEPAVGIGDFLKYIPAEAPCTAYEINPYSVKICKILYPQYEFIHDSFETRFIVNNDSIKDKINDIPKYDLVIGNPPYGEFIGRYAGMGEKSYTRAHNYLEYFILRGLDCLNPGGLLIYIIGCEVQAGGVPFLQQGPTKGKEMIAARADLLDAYRLYNGVFERTDVLSEIIVFKKK